MKSRFEDRSELIDDFAGYFLVHCPQCQGIARVSWSPSESAIRAICSGCGFIKDWTCVQPGVRMYTNDPSKFKVGIIGIGAGLDWCFHYPLWLSTSCCSHELWAYNPEHLAWLKAYVSSGLRERTEDPEFGWRNASLSSRLPKWLKSAKNRDEVIKAIERLEKTVPAA
jgi:hypothetical protein